MNKKEVHRAFREITGEVRALKIAMETFEKVRGSPSLEGAARQILAKIRDVTGKGKPSLGRPVGRGTPPQSEGNPRLREMVDELMVKVNKAAEKRRRPGGRW